MPSLDAIANQVSSNCLDLICCSNQHWLSFISLAPIPPKQDEYRDPCNPSPCGPFSQCRDSNGSPSCSCLPSYFGAPPNCRPECSINSECPSNKACIREKCQDPCPGSCGINANCHVINHTPVCTCSEHDTGDPFTNCYPTPPPRKNFMKKLLISLISNLPQPAKDTIPDDPCYPSPCGANAQCSNGICTCLPEYQGDAYTGCRPECVLNNDCPRNKACVRNKCIDPCPGTCGDNAICEVFNHVPMCSCPTGMTGNAFSRCVPYQCMYTYNSLLTYACLLTIFKPNQLPSIQTLVNPPHADQILYAVKSMVRQFAHVCLDI